MMIITLLFTYNSKLQLDTRTKYDSIWMPLAVYQDVQWSSVTCIIMMNSGCGRNIVSIIPTCGAIIVSIILSSLVQCSNNEYWWSSHFYFTYNLISRTKYDSIWMPLAVYHDVQWSSITCIKNDERWLSQKYYVSYMIMQSNMAIMMCSIKTERWKLHGIISRNGYGNAMIGRMVAVLRKI